MILVTGATGFIGRATIERAVQDVGHARAAIRVPATALAGVEQVVVGALGAETNWSAALRGVEVVVHTSARVHMMHDAAADPLKEFRRVNVAGTLNLARQARNAGVRRFVFISSIKVNGEATLPGAPFTADDVPAPLDPYGVSKYEAEQGVREIARHSMEVVVIRPVLVYGPGVKANFLAMMRWMRQGIPLPLGAIHNERSFVALDNLVHLIMTCVHHDAAANQTFLVSDGEDLSTTALLQRTAAALGRSAHLIPVPEAWLRITLTLLGKKALAQRLCASLQVDISKTRQLLGWVAPISVDEGLRRAAATLR